MRRGVQLPLVITPGLHLNIFTNFKKGGVKNLEDFRIRLYFLCLLPQSVFF